MSGSGDRLIAQPVGHVEGVDRGPLHGIPYAAKDLFDVRGLPTTAGSRLLADALADDDAAVVRRLTERGMVLLGKTNPACENFPAANGGEMAAMIPLVVPTILLGIFPALLLATNIVCVNLAAMTTFVARGVRPVTWWEGEQASRATSRAYLIWATALVLLIAAAAYLSTEDKKPLG